MSKVKPFLRWAGGKTWLIKHLKEIMGNLEYNNYYEPFLGSGSIFFHLSPPKAILSDSNEALIKTFLTIKKSPSLVYDKLCTFNNTEKDYYEVRQTVFNNDVDRAAQFIYLNHTSFNGIFRVNKSGKYNVPYGFRKNVVFNKETLLNASVALKETKILLGDFLDIKKYIGAHDLVFIDPPYTVSHNNNGFIEYNQKIFSLDDQKRLSLFIDHIKSVDAYYILTNAAHETIKEIFSKGDRLLEIKRASTIGGVNAVRDKVSEYIFTNIPTEEIIDEFRRTHIES